MIKRHGKVTLDFADNLHASANTAKYVDVSTPEQLALYYNPAGGQVRVVYPREWVNLMEKIVHDRQRAARRMAEYGPGDNLGSHGIGAR
jgi:hypothetical protein